MFVDLYFVCCSYCLPYCVIYLC